MIENIPEDSSGQDKNGRLWDALWMSYRAIKTAKEPGAKRLYTLLMSCPDKRREMTLKLSTGPGGNWEAVITIMLPNED